MIEGQTNEGPAPVGAGSGAQSTERETRPTPHSTMVALSPEEGK